MVSTSIFFWLAPGIFAVFSACFIIMATSARGYMPPRWAAAGGVAATSAALFDILRIVDTNSALLVSTALHYLAVALFVQGLLSRHGRTFHVKAGAVVLFGTLLTAYMLYVQPSLEGRIVLNGLTGSALLLCGLLHLPLARGNAIERLVWGFLALSLVVYLMRPMFFVVADGFLVRGTVGDAFTSGSMIVFYASTAFIGLGMLLVMMLAMGSDLIRQQAREARIDSLTGILNRRAHDDWLEAAREGRQSIEAVIIVDLDHFKRINDAFGHSAGDKVLNVAGRAMAAAVGDTGRFSRIGGEEFALLLTRQDADRAGELAELLRSAAKSAKVHTALPEVKLTASVGWARRASGESAQELERRADQALFEAKRAGRDRVCEHRIEFRPLQVVGGDPDTRSSSGRPASRRPSSPGG